MKRVAAFIDGFNLYHSLLEVGNSRSKWLDLRALCSMYLKVGENLTSITYFTSMVTWDQNKLSRHKRYIRALSLTAVKVIEGRFKSRTHSCENCGYKYQMREEKRTDVQIAVSILRSAARDEFDTAIVISGDTDLIPAIQALKELYPDKRVGILFPFRRHTTEMEQISDFSETIKAEVLERCRLPDRLQLPSGKYLTPPIEWQ